MGRRLPASVTALGQALLAQLTDDEVAALLPDPLPALTEQSITDLTKFTDELDQVRARGYALEREQGTPGVACVAVAVDYRIPATDAISCSMPAELPQEEIERIAEAVIRHTRKFAATLRREGIR
ncbi:IclR family transcriptional regulator domain-containing protein [Nonomuraea recticatena]|uniref:IclR family transcriptional regulator domain-containing protein n=1 Tax=Nonomuraea recticatena TaxID=46178 RepID=UPI00360AECA7